MGHNFVTYHFSKALNTDFQKEKYFETKLMKNNLLDHVHYF